MTLIAHTGPQGGRTAVAHHSKQSQERGAAAGSRRAGAGGQHWRQYRHLLPDSHHPARQPGADHRYQNHSGHATALLMCSLCPYFLVGKADCLHCCLWSRTSEKLHTCARSWDWCTGAQGKTAAASKNTRALLRPGKAAAATGTASVSGMSQQRMVRPCCSSMLSGACLFFWTAMQGMHSSGVHGRRLNALARQPVHAVGIRRVR